MAKDNSKISNADYEIRNAAKTMGVEPHFIHIAKSFVGNNREAVYSWVKEHKGLTISITVS